MLGDESTSMPQLGPYNTLNCRPLPTGGSTKKGLVIAMDVKPLDTSTEDQTIFSLRDSTNNNVFLAFVFNPPNGAYFTYNSDSGWKSVVGPSLASRNLKLVHLQSINFFTPFFL